MGGGPKLGRVLSAEASEDMIGQSVGEVLLQWVVYQHLITLVGVGSGIVLLGEGLGVNKVVGGAIILFGEYLARRQ